MDTIQEPLKLVELPRDVLCYLFAMLEAKDLAHVAAVCWDWYELLKDDELWGEMLHQWLLQISPHYAESEQRRLCANWGQFWSMKQFYTSLDFVEVTLLCRNMDTIQEPLKLVELPRDVLCYLFAMLEAKDLAHVAAVCWDWYELLKDDELWGEMLHQWLLQISPHYAESEQRRLCANWGQFWSMKQFYTSLDFVEEIPVKKQLRIISDDIKIVAGGSRCVIFSAGRSILVDSHSLSPIAEVRHDGAPLYGMPIVDCWNTSAPECCVRTSAHAFSFVRWGTGIADNTLQCSDDYALNIHHPSDSVNAVDYLDEPARLMVALAKETQDLNPILTVLRCGADDSRTSDPVCKMALPVNEGEGSREPDSRLLSLRDGRVVYYSCVLEAYDIGNMYLRLCDVNTQQKVADMAAGALPLHCDRNQLKMVRLNEHVVATASHAGSVCHLLWHDLRVKNCVLDTTAGLPGQITRYQQRTRLICHQDLAVVHLGPCVNAVDWRTGKTLRTIYKPCGGEAMAFDINWSEPLLVTTFQSGDTFSRTFEILEP
eukprot:TRINITY_DN1142_c0_g1_i3.p1 TRINITY_DN1142_c0_g1~~TRINITY_DN1142_c0_g1_i3.p1  ORF type:complete len:556 (+),score=83.27 TRINITY_DN1142_c0_g1_i3:44-1669(+)